MRTMASLMICNSDESITVELYSSLVVRVQLDCDTLGTVANQQTCHASHSMVLLILVAFW